MTKEFTQEDINFALHAAVENGYPEVITMSAEKIALELTECTAQFEDGEPDQLLPLIQSWQAAQVEVVKAPWEE